MIREFELVTRGFELVTCGFELVIHVFKLITRGFELITRAFELVAGGFELITRGFELITRGFELVHYYLMRPVGGDLSQHDHEFDFVVWRSPTEACRTLTYENEVEIVQKGASMVGEGVRED